MPGIGPFARRMGRIEQTPYLDMQSRELGENVKHQEGFLTLGHCYGSVIVQTVTLVDAD